MTKPQNNNPNLNKIMLTKPHQKFLLELAREAIGFYLKNGEILQIDESKIDEELKQERGVFVTLTKNGGLRGCIGHITPVQKLYLDVIENAINAAFNDYRFPPLSKEEFDEIEIEISVLSLPEKLDYSSPEDLLKKLEPKKHGVILSDGSHQATYLPQVWEQIPQKELFLSNLCQKAGLSPDTWINKKLEIQTYTVESFEE